MLYGASHSYCLKERRTAPQIPISGVLILAVVGGERSLLESWLEGIRKMVVFAKTCRNMGHRRDIRLLITAKPPQEN